MRIVVPLFLLCLAGCAPTQADLARQQSVEQAQQQRLATALTGFTPGQSTTCITLSRHYDTQIYGRTILYRMSPATVYRNDTSGGCAPDSRNNILITRTPTSQLCRGDIAQTIDNTSRAPTGSCSFGDFVPYRKGS